MSSDALSSVVQRSASTSPSSEDESLAAVYLHSPLRSPSPFFPPDPLPLNCIDDHVRMLLRNLEKIEGRSIFLYERAISIESSTEIREDRKECLIAAADYKKQAFSAFIHAHNCRDKIRAYVRKTYNVELFPHIYRS